jgi:hypothetical protein
MTIASVARLSSFSEDPSLCAPPSPVVYLDGRRLRLSIDVRHHAEQVLFQNMVQKQISTVSIGWLQSLPRVGRVVGETIGENVNSFRQMIAGRSLGLSPPRGYAPENNT